MYHFSPNSCNQPQHVTVSRVAQFMQTTTCRFLVLSDVNRISSSLSDTSQTVRVRFLSKVIRNAAPIVVGSAGCFARRATARFLLVERADGSMSAARVAKTSLSCTKRRYDTSCGTTFGGTWAAHNGLMSSLGTYDIPTIDHARGFREDDAHGVAQYVRAFWSHFFAREHTKT